MKFRKATLLLCVLCAACATGPYATLQPGKATEDDVEALMGPSADRREMPDGETVRYYSRLPWGRQNYAARFGADGKLIAIEQRLTRANLDRLVPGTSTADDVRDLLGPPFEVLHFPRQASEVWTYPMQDVGGAVIANIEFTPGGRLVEVRVYEQPSGD